MSISQNTKKTHDNVWEHGSLAHRVRHDIDFAETLNEKFLDSILKHESLGVWIRISISQTKEALEKYNNLAPMEDAKQTTRSDLKAIINRKQHERSLDACWKTLITCHSSLLAVIAIMSQFELVDIPNKIAASKDRKNSPRACSMPPSALNPKV
ncbi:hypothetical protein LZL87_007043 [Fusarium oxysporum]|nr:hypothetical protein LZL87_007043 [Fusarium oxysporum]